MAYTYSQQIVIDHTKCGSSDSTNFPMLFYGTYAALATVLHSGNIVNVVTVLGLSVPADLIFTSDAAGTVLLNWEVAYYNGTTGEIEVHIQVPTVSHSANTTIYMFAGNALTTTFQGGARGAAWDANYSGVFHLSDGTTLDVSDSTSNANNGTNNSGTASAGQIDGCLALSGSSQYVTMGNTMDPGSNPFTYSAWINAPASNQYGHILSKRQPYGSYAQADFVIGQFTSGGVATASQVLSILCIDGFTLQNYHTASNYADGTWHYVVLVRPTTGIPIIYVDGASVSLVAVNAYTGSALNCTNSGNFNIGYDNASAYLTGSVDEARVSNTARGADWILTEYNNQSSPSTFYTLSNIPGAGGGTNQLMMMGFGT